MLVPVKDVATLRSLVFFIADHEKYPLRTADLASWMVCQDGTVEEVKARAWANFGQDRYFSVDGAIKLLDAALHLWDEYKKRL